jgi:hypothetical protein
MSRQDLFRYVVEEFAEDYREGELERREFLRCTVRLGNRNLSGASSESDAHVYPVKRFWWYWIHYAAWRVG